MTEKLEKIAEESEADYPNTLLPDGNYVLYPMIRGDGFYKTLAGVIKSVGKGLIGITKKGSILFFKGVQEAYRGFTRYPFVYGTVKWSPNIEGKTIEGKTSDEERLNPSLANEIMNASNYGPHTFTLPGYNNPNKDKSA